MEKIMLNYVKQFGFNSLEEYYYKRDKAKTFEQQSLLNGELLGWILGVGGALLLLWSLAENKKTKSACLNMDRCEYLK